MSCQNKFFYPSICIIFFTFCSTFIGITILRVRKISHTFTTRFYHDVCFCSLLLPVLVKQNLKKNPYPHILHSPLLVTASPQRGAPSKREKLSAPFSRLFFSRLLLQTVLITYFPYPFHLIWTHYYPLLMCSVWHTLSVSPSDPPRSVFHL